MPDDKNLTQLTLVTNPSAGALLYVVDGGADYAMRFDALNNALTPQWGSIQGDISNQTDLATILATYTALISDRLTIGVAAATYLPIASYESLGARLAAIKAGTAGYTLVTTGVGSIGINPANQFTVNAPGGVAIASSGLGTVGLNTDGVAVTLQASAGVLIEGAVGPVFKVDHGGTGGAVCLIASTNVGFTGNIVQVNNGPIGTIFSIDEAGNVVCLGPVTTPRLILPPAALTPGVSVALDFDLESQQTLAIASDVTFTTANLAAGASKVVRITCDATPRSFVFPAWKFVGAAAPAGIAASKTALLIVRSFGTTDAACVASYSVEP